MEPFLDNLYFVSALASIVGLILGLFGRQFILNFIRYLGRPFLSIKYLRIGFYNLYASRYDLMRRHGNKVFYFMKKATDEIGIVALTLNAYIVNQDLHKDLAKAVSSNPGLEVNIFLLDPASPIPGKMVRASGWDEEDLKSSIRQSISMINNAIATLKEEDKVRYNLFLYDTIIPSWIIAIDPKLKSGKILVENHIYGCPIDERYSFELKRKGSKMYNKFEESYRLFKRDQINYSKRTV